jgi:hypothetical protein
MLIVLSTQVTAAPDPNLRAMLGLLAQEIAEARDKGSAYKPQYAKLIAACAD